MQYVRHQTLAVAMPHIYLQTAAAAWPPAIPYSTTPITLEYTTQGWGQPVTQTQITAPYATAWTGTAYGSTGISQVFLRFSASAQGAADALRQLSEAASQVQAVAWAATTEQERRDDEAAEAMLRELIGDRRYEVYRRDGYVVVSSRGAGHRLRYRIKPRQMIQLEERAPDGTWRRRPDRLCIHPKARHPAADEVATLVLLARYDERELWRTANVHGRDDSRPDWRAVLAA